MDILPEQHGIMGDVQLGSELTIEGGQQRQYAELGDGYAWSRYHASDSRIAVAHHVQGMPLPERAPERPVSRTHASALPPIPMRAPEFSAQLPARNVERRVTYGPDEPESGVARFTIGRTTPTPSHAYVRSPFAADSRTLQDRLADTPKLDPKPFGNRPAAAPDADRRLQSGDDIVVLDGYRRALRDEQRQLLQQVVPPPKSDEQIRRRDALTSSVVNELDYATHKQAAPDRDAADAILQRAPDDPVYARAVDRAKQQMETTWRAEGRTADQIGKLLEAGKAGQFDRVTQLAKEQLVDLGGKVGPDTPRHEAYAAILRRAGVYSTYVTGDPRYERAIGQAVEQAAHEVLVEKPIQRVLAEATAPAWPVKAMAALVRETDPTMAMPDHVQKIMGDDRIKHAVQQSLRLAPSLDAPADGPVETISRRVLHDVALVYGRTLATDEATPGAGMALVDETASFILNNTEYYTHIGAREAWSDAFREATREGYPGLALAVSSKAGNYRDPGFAGHQAIADGPTLGHPAFSGRSDPIHAVLDGIRGGGKTPDRGFVQRLEGALENNWQKAQFIQAPLHDLRADASEEDRKALIDGLFKAFPKDAAAWQDAIKELSQLQEQKGALGFSLQAYAPASQGKAAFDQVQKAWNDLPGDLPATWTQAMAETSSTWLQRSARLLTTTLLSLGPDTVLGKTSRGFSGYLFERNALELVNSELIDQMFVPVHAAMGFGEMSKAFMSESAREKLWGVTPKDYSQANPKAGPNDPFANARRYQDLEAKMTRFLESGRIPPSLKDVIGGFGRGALASRFLAPLDMAYAFVDGTNAYAYLTGNLRDGKTDMARGAAYVLSTAGDGSFIVSSALDARKFNPATARLGQATFLRMTPFAWNVAGAAFLVAASSINYYKGRYEKAHALDEHYTKAWQILGIKKPEVAAALATGDAWSDRDMHMNASAFLKEYFRRSLSENGQGSSTEAMIKHINEKWTVRHAQAVAALIKDLVERDGPDGDFITSPQAFTRNPFVLLEHVAGLRNIPLPSAGPTP